MKPHKHAELIKAWADGASIEKLTKDGWLNCEPNYILWSLDVEYRIKPEPKPDETSYLVLSSALCGWAELTDYASLGNVQAEILIIRDGETNKIKYAEVVL